MQKTMVSIEVDIFSSLKEKLFFMTAYNSTIIYLNTISIPWLDRAWILLQLWCGLLFTVMFMKRDTSVWNWLMVCGLLKTRYSLNPLARRGFSRGTIRVNVQTNILKKNTVMKYEKKNRILLSYYNPLAGIYFVFLMFGFTGWHLFTY